MIEDERYGRKEKKETKYMISGHSNALVANRNGKLGGRKDRR